MYTSAPPIRSGSLPLPVARPNWEYKPTDPTFCSHLQGSLGPHPSFRTGIVWHELNTGTQFGICLNCQRQFWPSDPDYVEWRRKPCGNTTSSAVNHDPVIPEEIPVVPTVANDVMGDFDILFGEDNRNIIILRGKEAQ